ncbi:hypothetical protein P7K49_034901 [Saguinus oedipus]|uniref:Uncharacterized protein n=1 Tax=Saguinus oedipus TaxID=9490 RepID=A0ABQ9TW55_SAGOE|nr:hypothetical protein P7K49_034900 [Saguinus oedipus]KAK2088994.1 hypothetical protein P7K49_034901 [Saguinus oedipus]
MTEIQETEAEQGTEIRHSEWEETEPEGAATECTDSERRAVGVRLPGRAEESPFIDTDTVWLSYGLDLEL